jgi:hypothetical protein
MACVPEDGRSIAQSSLATAAIVENRVNAKTNSLAGDAILSDHVPQLPVLNGFGLLVRPDVVFGAGLSVFAD